MFPAFYESGIWLQTAVVRLPRVPHNERGKLLQELIPSRIPDVICLTEAKAALLPDRGHLIESDPDYGYPIKEGRRKVFLWSSLPWGEVSIHDDLDFPSGRIVSGVTVGLRFVGVCIPWSALVLFVTTFPTFSREFSRLEIVNSFR